MDATYPDTPAQRPTFLTVLCILSFIGGTWGVIDGYRTGFTDKAQQDLEKARTAIEEAMDTMGDGGGFARRMMEEGMAMAELGAENAGPLGGSGLVLSLLGLAGVWMMWNLKRIGFWVYTVASLGGLIAPLAILGSSMLVIMSLGLGGLFTLLFIILYAVNLKHMR